MAGEDVVGSARIRIDLDDSGVQADALLLGRRIKDALERGARGIGATVRRDIQRALRTPVRVTVLPDLRRFDAQLLAGLRSLDSINIPVAPDVGEFMARLRAALAGEEVSVRVVPDLSGFDDRLRAHRPPTLTARVDADAKGTRRVTSALGALGSALRITGAIAAVTAALGVLGGAAAASAASLLTLTAALTPMVGIVAALPAAITGAVTMVAALRLALMGVGDAFGAALTEDSKKFTESIKNLSPAAKAAAKELRALKPAFEALRESVQNAFFKPLAGQITRVADALGGQLRKQLSAIAGLFGTAASEIAKFLTSARGVSAVEQILAGTWETTRGLTAGLVPLTKGFLDVAAAVQTAFGAQLGNALESAGERLGSFLSRSADNGAAVAWVSRAIGVFQQLGTVLANVGSIFDSVLDAARTAGGDILGVFGQVTGQLAKFLGSDAGQSALVGVFETLGAVGAALGPVLQEIVKQIGALAPAFVPIIQVAGPALTGLLASLGPALRAIMPGLQALVAGLAAGLTVLGPALQPLGAALSGAFAALAPLLPVVGQLAALVGTVLTGGLRLLTAALQPVISAVAGALTPILPQLAALLGQVTAAAMPLAAVVGEQLGVAVQELLPPILELIPQLLTGLLPAFTQLVATAAPLVPLVTQLAITALQPLVGILPNLVELFIALVNSVTPALPLIQQLLPPVLQLANAILGWVNLSVVLPILQGIIGALTWLVTTLTGIVSGIAGFVGQVIGWFQRLYNVLVGNSIIPELVMGIIRWFAKLPVQLVTLASQLVSRVVGKLGELGGRAARAVSDLAGRLGGKISEAAGRAVAAAGRLVSNVVAKFGELPRRALAAIGDIGSQIASRIRGSVPSGIRDLLPFANGGIVWGPTPALIGEAGPEVVIPLSRPQRARELAEQSGLVDILAAGLRNDRRSSRPAGGQQPTIVNHFTIHEVGDGRVTAERVINRLTIAAGVLL